MYEGSTVLITGGTGSWGNELVQQLLEKNPKEIRIFSRNELSQVLMERKFNNDKLRFVIGDIRDKEAILKATEGVDYIFHLAALKHVPICEKQPNEAIKTNVGGTQNLIEASIINKVKKVIDVSTDKAVDSLNLYGMTKAVGERLIIQANQLTNDTRFVCIRAGNVLGSNGSVVPLFIEQIKRYNSITITNKEMTRYFMTLQEAIGLLFQAAEKSIGGEIFVMRMPACKILDLANVLIATYGNKDTQIKDIGMRPGEKLHEVLVSEYEAPHTYSYNDKYYLIAPTLVMPYTATYYGDFGGLLKVKFNRYASNDELMSEEEILSVLKVGRFIEGEL
ncbi:MAG: polysaccharide biosynthesis protein [Cellulosilyticaceae bacterium]